MLVEFFVSIFLDNVPDVVVILHRDSDGFTNLTDSANLKHLTKYLL